MSTITQSDQQSEVANAYRIYSRWPQRARWRIVRPLPHSEHRPFDPKVDNRAYMDAAREAVFKGACYVHGVKTPEQLKELTNGYE